MYSKPVQGVHVRKKVHFSFPVRRAKVNFFCGHPVVLRKYWPLLRGWVSSMSSWGWAGAVSVLTWPHVSPSLEDSAWTGACSSLVSRSAFITLHIELAHGFFSPKKLRAYTYFIYHLRWPMFTHCMDPVCWHVLLLSYQMRSHCIKTHVMDHCALGLSPYQEKLKLNHKFWNLRMQFWLF